MIASFDSSDEEDGSAELFSPSRGRDKSLVPDSTPSRSHSTVAEESSRPAWNAATKNSARTDVGADNSNSKNNDDDDDDRNRSYLFAGNAANTLPKLQDTSWLGADVSPIRDRPDEHHAEKAVAPFRLGVPESTASSVAATESFFLAADDDIDDLEGNNHQPKPTPTNAGRASGGGATSSRNSVFGETGATFNGSVRPRPTLLGHPLTKAAAGKIGDGYAGAGEKDKYNTTQRRRRRMMPNPLQRTFWSAPTPSFDSSSYNMIDGPPRLTTANRRGVVATRLLKGNRFVLGSTALVLFCVGLHDAFLAYLGMRRGITASYGFAWTLPWFGPTARSLLRFGAFCPERLLSASASAWWVSRWWRSFASLAVSISLVEWTLLVWVWTMYLPSSVFSPKTNFSWQLSWPVVYLLSAWTGQLWMVAFHRESILLQQQSGGSNDYGSDGAFPFPAVSGCAGWGTAGVLCAVGIQVPNRRFPCFVSSIGLVLIHQCQAAGSVVGCAAAAFWGWAYSGLWAMSSSSRATERMRDHPGNLHHPDYAYYHDVLFGGENAADEKRRWTPWHVFSAIVVFLLWYCPVIFLVYR